MNYYNHTYKGKRARFFIIKFTYTDDKNARNTHYNFMHSKSLFICF